MTAGEEAQSQKPSVLESALKACRRGIVGAVTFGLFINLLMLTASLYMLQVFDRVIQSRSTDTLLYLTLIALIALVTLGLLDGVRGKLMLRLSCWLENRLGQDILAGGITASVRQGTSPSTQGLRDLQTVRTFVTGPGMVAIMDSPWAPIFVAVIFLLHPILGWMSVAGAIMLMALAIINELFTRQLIGQSAMSSNRAIAQAEAATRNARVIVSMGMLPQIVRRWHARNGEALSAHTVAGNRASAITATSKVIRQALQILVLGAGAWLVLKNELTPGAMIATSILMARALAPVESAIGSWRSAVGALDAYRRVKETLSTQTPEPESVSLPRPKGRLSAERITYRHPGQKESTLRNINFELGAGETLAILGATAAGKSTLANILVGNIVPQVGQARLDSADVAHISTDDRNRYVGFLPQDVELFGGTVRENIARMTNASDDEVVAAAQRAGAHEVILGLPQGYDTEIGDSGTALSGGQRQQVGLARALFGDPRFVVLDEPNANLDNLGEQRLIATFEALKNDLVTLVFITHRPNILRTADKILILKDGSVAQFGAREDVLQQVMRPEPAVAGVAG